MKRSKLYMFLAAIMSLLFFVNSAVVFAVTNQRINAVCSERLQRYYDKYFNRDCDYLKVAKLDIGIFKKAISNLDISTNSGLYAFAEYGKNTLTGSTGMILRNDPAADETETMTQAIFHETIHRIEDLNGDMDLIEKNKAYDERNADYIQFVIEKVSVKLMFIENMAKSGAKESDIEAKVKELHSVWNSYKNNMAYFPSASDMKKWFGFSFDLGTIEDYYAKSSRYTVLKKVFSKNSNRLKPTIPPAASPSKNGYWLLKVTAKNINDSVNDGNIKANSNIINASYQIYPGGGSMSTTLRWFESTVSIRSMHTFSIPATLIPGQKAYITLGVADGGSSKSSVNMSHSTSVGMWINRGGSWYSTGQDTCATKIYKTEDNPDKSFTESGKTVEFTVPDKAEGFTAHFSINGGSAPGSMVINYDYEFVNSSVVILQVGNKKLKINGYEKDVEPGKSTAPVLNGKIVMVPAKALSQALGGTAVWNASSKKLTYKQSGKTFEMWIGKNKMKVGSTYKSIDTAPVLIKGTPMVPVKSVAENLNYKVRWDAKTKQLIMQK